MTGGKMETLLFVVLGLLVLGSGLALSGLVLTGVIAVARAGRAAWRDLFFTAFTVVAF